MRLRKEKPRTPWKIDIHPDVVKDREWDETDGNHYRVGRPGWIFVARREHPYALELGEADSYLEALTLAREAVAKRA